jgi:hypothetical protein
MVKLRRIKIRIKFYLFSGTKRVNLGLAELFWSILLLVCQSNHHHHHHHPPPSILPATPFGFYIFYGSLASLFQKVNKLLN